MDNRLNYILSYQCPIGWDRPPGAKKLKRRSCSPLILMLENIKVPLLCGSILFDDVIADKPHTGAIGSRDVVSNPGYVV